MNSSQDWSIDVNDLHCVEILKAYDDVVIYKGLWRKHQIVCVKQILVRTPKQAALIHREICILGMCVHPHVCQYLGSANDTDQNIVHIVFEYMERGNLDDYITQQNRVLTVREKLDILMAVAVGLEYLWLRRPCRIIHRDFKPSNILLNRHGDAKIADFGMSTWFSATTSPTSSNTFQTHLNNNINVGSNDTFYTQQTVVGGCGSSPSIYDLSHEGVGTVRWTAPELLCENRYNHLCDIYSFGLVAYFVWTDGEIPYFKEYNNNGAQIAFAKSINTRPFLEDPKLNLFADNGSGGMRRLVEMCTEKNTKLRPQNPAEIITMLQEEYTHHISSIYDEHTTVVSEEDTFCISL